MRLCVCATCAHTPRQVHVHCMSIVTGCGPGHSSKGDHFLSEDETENKWNCGEHEWVPVSVLPGQWVWLSAQGMGVGNRIVLCSLA